jgi:hypothetical protein
MSEPVFADAVYLLEFISTEGHTLIAAPVVQGDGPARSDIATDKAAAEKQLAKVKEIAERVRDLAAAMSSGPVKGLLENTTVHLVEFRRVGVVSAATAPNFPESFPA